MTVSVFSKFKSVSFLHHSSQRNESDDSLWDLEDLGASWLIKDPAIFLKVGLKIFSAEAKGPSSSQVVRRTIKIDPDDHKH